MTNIVIQPPLRTRTRRRDVAAAVLGIALEWYDLIIYAFMAPVIAKLFFPGGGSTAMLLTVATLGVGFVARPLGGLVLGVVADRVGRSEALAWGMGAMTTGTALIALAPTYEDIGLLAPAIIVLGRLVQGFAAAGEFGGGSAFLLELAPRGREGLYASLQASAQFLAAILASLVGLALASLLTEQQIADWGWRLPFAAGLVVGPIGLWLRTRLPDHASEPLFSIQSGLKQYRGAIGAGLAATIFATVGAYVLVLYMPSFAAIRLHLPMAQAMAASTGMSALLVLLCPLAGALSDRLPRTALPIGAACVTIVCTQPLLSWLQTNPGFGPLCLVLAAFSVPLACYIGVLPALISEVLPRPIRCTGVALGYNLAVMMFGGFAPAIVAALALSMGEANAAALYVGAAAIPSLIGLNLLGRRYRPENTGDRRSRNAARPSA